jgi:glycosyltransferase involved in cell wall biosynthesis
VKILWVNANFMHPTNKGGSIRTLEMLRYLHRWHEIHYVAIEDPAHPEGPLLSKEYCSRAYPFRRRVPGKNSLAYYGQVAGSLFASIPLAMTRYSSPALGRFLDELMRKERFDRAVADHLTPATYFPGLERSVLFQHNVETVIWRRYAEHAEGALRKWYFGLQARRMFAFERRICRAAGHIVAVSDVDARMMRELFGATRISDIPTGVNIEYFAPPSSPESTADLVFVGSMDWMANEDGVLYFVREILPLIRRRRPETSFAIVGRRAPPSIADLGRQDPRILVTGTVPDVRPYLWGSRVSIVPLRIGGGTRLKIYESMAARVPVVSTTVGAEGLTVEHPENIRIADTPADFADRCLELLEDAGERQKVAAAAWNMILSRFSWEHVSHRFEKILQDAPGMS